MSDRRQENLEAQQARENRRYIEEHSENAEELKVAEEALRERGFDPGTGLPL